MEFADRLIRLCSREAGLTALLGLPAQGGALPFWLLCTEKSFAAMPQTLPRLAAAAVYYHGLAGDLCAGRFGEYAMLPGDMIEALPQVLKEQEDQEGSPCAEGCSVY